MNINVSPVGLQWQWQANPNPLWCFPNYDVGLLRLFAWEISPEYSNLWGAGNLLLQKFPAVNFRTTMKFKFTPYKDDERAGLIIMGTDYATISIASVRDSFEIRQTVCLEADKGGEEKINEVKSFKKQQWIYFRVEVRGEGSINKAGIYQERPYCRYSYSLDGEKYIPIGEMFEAKEGKWIGAKVGVFCERKRWSNDSGYIDVDWFTVEAI
ncbi:hypothetical protein FACS1894153_4660 [Bacteroidia bacterium]|nr:hypothetical protein FACS1894153_4660 [Bacteroidia bacterium]